MTFEKCIVRFLIAWCFAGTFLLASNNQKYINLEFFVNTNFKAMLIALILIFAILSLILFKSKGMKIDKILLFSIASIYFGLSLLINADIYYYTGVMFIMGILIYYCFKGNDSEVRINTNITKSVYVFLALVFILFVGGLTSLRYITYNAPGFDFGIFTQMFHSMKTTLLPNTTCELDMLSSHFAVHVSPIYYLILPFYYIFPNPVTLQIAQAVILASGMIPLYLLCKKFKLPNFVTFAIGICFAFYPALSGGCFYDIHENAFLTPLILWLFYFIEKEKLWGILTFSFLIFMVKEDAPIYVAFIAVYMLFGKKQYKRGSVVLVLSLLYFILVLWLLKTYGQGAKFDRFDNYNYDGSGIVAVIKSAIINPAYIISQCMTQEKLIFILKMLIPLAFLPLINKNISKFILVGPFVLVNLMSNYLYQHSIEFQYNFGVIGIFFYLAVSNLESFKPRFQKMFALFCAVSTVFLFSFTMLSKVSLINAYSSDRERIDSINKCIELIPKDAAVSASAFIVPHLYDHNILYELPTKHDTEYVVYDMEVKTEGVSLSDYENGDYKVLYYDYGTVALFRLKSEAPA